MKTYEKTWKCTARTDLPKTLENTENTEKSLSKYTSFSVPPPPQGFPYASRFPGVRSQNLWYSWSDIEPEFAWGAADLGSSVLDLWWEGIVCTFCRVGFDVIPRHVGDRGGQRMFYTGKMRQSETITADSPTPVMIAPRYRGGRGSATGLRGDQYLLSSAQTIFRPYRCMVVVSGLHPLFKTVILSTKSAFWNLPNLSKGQNSPLGCL